MQDSHLAVNHAIEVIGRVQDDLSVKVLNSTDFGTDFGELNSVLTIHSSYRLTCADFSAAESVVDATHRYREIFYGDD
jgi:replication factor A3